MAEQWEEAFEKRMPGLLEGDRTPYRLGHHAAIAAERAKLAPVIAAALEVDRSHGSKTFTADIHRQECDCDRCKHDRMHLALRNAGLLDAKEG